MKRPFTFQIKHLFLLLIVIGVVFGANRIFVIFFSVASLPIGTGNIQIRLSSGNYPYLAGASVCSKLQWWLEKSKPVFFYRKKHMELMASLCFDAGNKDVSVPFYVCAFEKTPKRGDLVYFRWNGKMRSGDYYSLREILFEPKSVQKKSPLISYDDTNEDGRIDIKIQVLDTSHDIIWKDTDADGYFDKEFVWNHGLELSDRESIVHVKVPSAGVLVQGN